MGPPQTQPRMDFRAFLNWVETQEGRFEFVAGAIFATGGGSAVHSTTATNLTGALWAHLRGNPCQVYNSDMAVRIEVADALYYPDVTVSCENPSNEQQFLVEPKVIAEVLSPSTKRFDRQRKFHDYWTIPTLREYLLIDPDTQFVDVYQRTAAADWTLHSFRADETLHLASLDFALPLRELWPAAGALEPLR